MSSNQIGVGVVGYGYWGPNLVRNFAANADAQVVSVCDLDATRLKPIARLFPGVSVTIDYRDLLGDNSIDLIAVATPSHSHFELAMAALKAGKHVLVEKPLTTSSKLAQRLIDEADRRGLRLMVDHTFLFTPAVRKIIDLTRRGELGEIYYYDSTRVSLGLFQSDVSVIWDLAVHDVAILDHILQETPVAVSATGTRHVPGSPENMAQMTIFFDSACVAHIKANWLSPVKVRQTLIGGAKKMIVYDDMEPTEKIKVYDRGITINASEENTHQLRIGYRAGDMWAPHIGASEALQIEIEHIVGCIRSGATPLCDGLSGLRVIEVLEAASRSMAKQGEPVRLDHLTRNRSDAKLAAMV